MGAQCFCISKYLLTPQSTVHKTRTHIARVLLSVLCIRYTWSWKKIKKLAKFFCHVASRNQLIILNGASNWHFECSGMWSNLETEIAWQLSVQLQFTTSLEGGSSDSESETVRCNFTKNTIICMLQQQKVLYVTKILFNTPKLIIFFMFLKRKKINIAFAWLSINFTL